MSASGHTNNGPRANDAVANRDDREDADATHQGPAAPVDDGGDETANDFGSAYQGDFGYGSGYGNNNNNDGDDNRNPNDGTRKYEPAVRDIRNMDEKSRGFHSCKPSRKDPSSGPSDKDGDSSNRT